MRRKFCHLITIVATFCLSSCMHSGSAVVAIRAIDAHSKQPLTQVPITAHFQTVVFSSIAQPSRFELKTDHSGIVYLRNVADGDWTIHISPVDREPQMAFFHLSDTGLSYSTPEVSPDGAAVALVASNIYSPPIRKTLIYATIIPPTQPTKP